MPKPVPIGCNHYHHIKSSVASIQRPEEKMTKTNTFSMLRLVL